MGYKMYVSPTNEQAAAFYNRLFPFPQIPTTPYKITGPRRINPVAKAVRVALGPRSLADIQDHSRRHIEVCDA